MLNQISSGQVPSISFEFSLVGFKGCRHPTAWVRGLQIEKERELNYSKRKQTRAQSKKVEHFSG